MKKNLAAPLGSTNLGLFLVFSIKVLLSLLLKKISLPYGRYKSWVISSFHFSVFKFLLNLMLKKNLAALRAAQILGYF